MGGSTGKSSSSSGGGFQQDVWGPQGSALGDLYNAANNAYGQSDRYQNSVNQAAGGASRVNSGATRQSQNMMGQGFDQGMGQQNAGFNTGMQGANQMLGGGSIGDTSDIRSSLMSSINQPLQRSNMGSMYESIVGGQGNSYIDPMVDSMKASSAENLQGMQNRNAMEASAMGQSGSSRHAMQNAMTARGINNDQQNLEAQMRGGAYDKDLAMKMGIAQQADTNMMQNKQMNQSNLMGLLGQGDANVQSGMGMSSNLAGMGNQVMQGAGQFGSNYGQSVQNLGMGQMAPHLQAQQASQQPLQQYANVLGNPTVLGAGSTNGKSKGSGASSGLKG
jgi:hypothetical protein